MTLKRSLISAEGRWLRAAVAAGILLVVGLIAVFGSEASKPPLFIPCGFHAVSGLPCLFCGGTRAARAILHGDFHRAAYLNVLAFPALGLAAAMVAVLLLEAVSGRPVVLREAVSRSIGRALPAIVIVALAWWAIHIFVALRTPKPELVDFRNPVAAWAAAHVREFVR